MSDEQRDSDEPRTPATALLERIGRLARQARLAAETLADRLLVRTGTRPRPVPVRAPAPTPVSEPEAPPAPEETAAPEAEDAPAPAPTPVSEPEAPPAPEETAAPEPEIAPAPEPYVLDSVDDGLPALPTDYGEARVVLLSRDPHWLFCYWDLPARAGEAPRASSGRLALRLHDVTDLEFDGHNSWSQHLYPMTEGARWWHVPLPRPQRFYLAEVGRLAPSGAFMVLGQSGAISTPATGPSSKVGEEMATLPPDESPGPDGPLAQPFVPPTGDVAEGSAAGIHGGVVALAPSSAPTSSSPWSVPR